MVERFSTERTEQNIPANDGLVSPYVFHGKFFCL